MKFTRIPKHPWWFPAIQLGTLAILAAFAITNAVSNHGVMMAVNCFCIGFLFFAAMMGRMLDRRVAKMDALVTKLEEAHDTARAVAAKFEKAVEDGVIEVVVTDPDQPTTRH